MIYRTIWYTTRHCRKVELARLVRILDPGSLFLHSKSNTIYSVKIRYRGPKVWQAGQDYTRCLDIIALWELDIETVTFCREKKTPSTKTKQNMVLESLPLRPFVDILDVTNNTSNGYVQQHVTLWVGDLISIINSMPFLLWLLTIRIGYIIVYSVQNSNCTVNSFNHNSKGITPTRHNPY